MTANALRIESREDAGTAPLVLRLLTLLRRSHEAVFEAAFGSLRKLAQQA
jgi:hypothetical protein